MTLRYLRACAAKHADPATKLRIDCPWCGTETVEGDAYCCESVQLWHATTYQRIRHALREKAKQV